MTHPHGVEYVKYTKEARQTPFPYEALYLKHKLFKNFSNMKYYNSVRPGRNKATHVSLMFAVPNPP